MSVVKMVKKERKKNRIYKICTDKVVHDKKMKAVKDANRARSVRMNQKDIDFRHLGYLMGLGSSDELWVRNKTLILSGI
ncbi:hypothetical protein ACLOJK_029955 [Asimina triloba]